MGAAITRRICAGSIAALAAITAAAQTAPPGFTDVEIVPVGAGGVVRPTAIAYEPGAGHLWICEQGDALSGIARVRRRDAGTLVLSTPLTLPVDKRGERGLLGIAFDPDFLDPSGLSRFVYLYYTAPTPVPHNRVSRFTEASGLLSAEQVILEGPDLLASPNHNGGCLRFRSDKTLFISMGDNETGYDPNPLARDMSDLRGKVLRINADGTIPADNPFVGVPGIRPEIYEFGMRNPWRFDFDSDNDTLYIGDVGESERENVYVGLAGADHGWPCFEGTRPFAPCSGTLPPGSVTFPIFWYCHFGCGTPRVMGRSITGGPVYRATAFPPEYQGNYYFADYADGYVYRARIAPDGSLGDVQMFVNRAAFPVDMVVSPVGCLTYAGSGIHDVCFVPGANGPPVAVASARPSAGLAPLDVQFSGSASRDPDLDPLTFAWAFGDALTDTVADPLHQYVADGVYEAVLTVNDGRGAPNSQDASPRMRIVVGNRPPVPIITAPPDRLEYDAGDLILFSGTATDPEDGIVPATSFEWTVVFHHGTHQHPFLGPIRHVDSSQFAVPITGEDATDVFFRIWLSAIDTGNPVGPEAALEATTWIDILPHVTTTTLVADPPVQGLQLGWDGRLADAPQSHRSVAGFTRRITAPSPQIIGPDTWDFVSWSDAGSADHVIAAPTSDATIVATFRCIAGCIEAGNCADGVDNDVDGSIDCADSECAGNPACSEGGLCQGGIDDDGDTLVDCADSDCIPDPGCASQDFDGDGAPNGIDCVPTDATAFAVPPELARLDLAKLPLLGAFGVRLTWTSQVPLAGSGTTSDIATALVSSLQRAIGADAPCVANDVPGTMFDEATSIALDGLYYLVRGGTVCGNGPWGRDSLGVARPTCP